MSFSKEEITKKLTFDQLLDEVGLEVDGKVTLAQKREILEEIGDYIRDTMLDFITEGKSPVTARKFKRLSTPYSDDMKGGDRTADMQLEGDMLDALDFKVKKDYLEIGWFDSDQAAKAFGHTTGMEGHPWLEGKTPVRKLIPDEKGFFAAEIRDGIADIIEDIINAD